MIFRQIFDSNSFTYTYLISSGIGREALIIDPVLEKVDQYIKLLKELDLKLVKVIDTHIHADHISGIAELRDKTNCVTVMGDKTPADVVAMKVSDEETVKIEGIDLKALYTPGHTSESFSFLMACIGHETLAVWRENVFPLYDHTDVLLFFVSFLVTLFMVCFKRFLLRCSAAISKFNLLISTFKARLFFIRLYLAVSFNISTDPCRCLYRMHH